MSIYREALFSGRRTGGDSILGLLPDPIAAQELSGDEDSLDF